MRGTQLPGSAAQQLRNNNGAKSEKICKLLLNSFCFSRITLHLPGAAVADGQGGQAKEVVIYSASETNKQAQLKVTS